jgi:hypothetical protein
MFCGGGKEQSLHTGFKAVAVVINIFQGPEDLPLFCIVSRTSVMPMECLISQFPEF